jgi:hypothetical protein
MHLYYIIIVHILFVLLETYLPLQLFVFMNKTFYRYGVPPGRKLFIKIIIQGKNT